MSRKHARMRVRLRECGYLRDPRRQPFRYGRLMADMSPRRAAKSARIRRRHRRRVVKRWADMLKCGPHPPLRAAVDYFLYYGLLETLDSTVPQREVD